MAARDERRDEMQTTERVTPDPHEPGGNVRTLAAREILGAGGVVRIDLDGEIYTLRLTRNQRLILTK